MEKLILECVIRSALIALCTAMALYILRVKAARVRHVVWTSVVALMLLLPAWTAWGPKAVLRVLQPAPAIVDSPPAVTQQLIASEDQPALPARGTPWTWQDSLLALYLAGFCALMLRLMTGTVRAIMLVRRAVNQSGRLTSDSCVAPVTVGWLKPSVILPQSWTLWSRAQLNAVLAHEDEHARRRDPLVQWLALFNRAVFWFHPLAWWLERRLSALSEEACDDVVLARGHDPVEYSECLLGLARVVQESGARLTAVGMAMPGTFLPQRIRRIVEGEPMQRISRLRMSAVAAACTLVSAVFTTGAIGYAAATPPPPPPAISVAPPVDLIETPAPVHKRAPVLLAQAKPTPAATPAPDDRFTRADGPHLAVGTSSVSGTVLDPSSAVVPNAPVTLTNTDTKATRTVNADNTGAYHFLQVDPGNYSLTVKASGFKTSVQTRITVASGEDHNAGKVLLQLGSIAESVSITGSRSAVAAAVPMVRDSGPMTTVGPMTTLDQTAAQARYTAVAGRQTSQAVAGGPIKVGGNVQAANLTSQVRPVYPVDLQQQGVQGTVRFEAILTKEGTLDDIQVVPGNTDPRLTQPALDAVRQWRYKPTILNGEPVDTMTTIDVNFSVTN